MRDCSVDFAFFKKSMAKTVAGNKVIGPYCHRPLVMNDRVADSFLLNKSVSMSPYIAACRHVSAAKTATIQSTALKIKVRLRSNASAKLIRAADASAIGPIQAKY